MAARSLSAVKAVWGGRWRVEGEQLITAVAPKKAGPPFWTTVSLSDKAEYTDCLSCPQKIWVLTMYSLEEGIGIRRRYSWPALE